MLQTSASPDPPTHSNSSILSFSTPPRVTQASPPSNPSKSVATTPPTSKPALKTVPRRITSIAIRPPTPSYLARWPKVPFTTHLEWLSTRLPSVKTMRECPLVLPLAGSQDTVNPQTWNPLRSTPPTTPKPPSRPTAAAKALNPQRKSKTFTSTRRTHRTASLLPRRKKRRKPGWKKPHPIPPTRATPSPLTISN